MVILLNKGAYSCGLERGSGGTQTPTPLPLLQDISKASAAIGHSDGLHLYTTNPEASLSRALSRTPYDSGMQRFTDGAHSSTSVVDDLIATKEIRKEQARGYEDTRRMSLIAPEKAKVQLFPSAYAAGSARARSGKLTPISSIDSCTLGEAYCAEEEQGFKDTQKAKLIESAVARPSNEKHLRLFCTDYERGGERVERGGLPLTLADELFASSEQKSELTRGGNDQLRIQTIADSARRTGCTEDTVRKVTAAIAFSEENAPENLNHVYYKMGCERKLNGGSVTFVDELLMSANDFESLCIGHQDVERAELMTESVESSSDTEEEGIFSSIINFLSGS